MGVSCWVEGFSGACPTANEQTNAANKTDLIVIVVARSEMRASFRLYSVPRGETKPGFLRGPSCPLWLKALQGLLDADFQRLISMNHDLGMRDGFKPHLDLEIKLVVAIASPVIAGFRVRLKPLFHGLVGTDAFHYAPRLVQGSGCGQHILDLISPRKWTSIEKDFQPWIPR